MDNEKEISFGAFDSELMRQEIFIPEGFEATIEGDKIILTRTESEDEKIRKALLELVHDTTGDELWVDYNFHKEDAIAWLEKQGEHKVSVVDFKAKDWYVSKVDGKIHNITYNPTEKKELKESDNYCRENCKGFQETGKCFADGDCRDKREAERKSAWSEEDETRLQVCIDCLQAKSLMGKVDTVMTNWLKSLKDRYTWKPNDEQMKALHDLNLTGGISYAGQGQVLIELYNDLKKLKE